MDKVKNTNSKEFKNIKNIVFDYDGTLHNSIKIYDKSRANENERSTPLIFHIIFK